jgi:signal transduction histidine kinase
LEGQLDGEREDPERRFLRLLSVVRHELLTPLSVIDGYTELLDPERTGGPPTPEEAKDALEGIRRNVHLALLLVTRLQAAEQVLKQHPPELDREDVNLAAFVGEVVGDVRETLLADHDVIVEAPEDPLGASIDPARIRQVLFNLLSNAAKYSDPGTTIRVAVRATDDGLEVAVTDEGQGIARKTSTRLSRPSAG